MSLLSHHSSLGDSLTIFGVYEDLEILITFFTTNNIKSYTLECVITLVNFNLDLKVI